MTKPTRQQRKQNRELVKAIEEYGAGVSGNRYKQYGTTTSQSEFGSTPLFLLFLVFLVLKLTHVIDWSWWWVTCPLWAGLAFVILFLVFGLSFGILGVALAAIKAVFTRRK